MNEITEYIASIFQHSGNSELLWLAAFICIILLILLTWLILRRIRLWYWKVDVQIDTLKNIDHKLKHLEEGIKEGDKAETVAEAAGKVEAAETAGETAATEAEPEPEIKAGTETEPEVKPEPEPETKPETKTVGDVAETTTAEMKEVLAGAGEQSVKSMEKVYGKSKTGRIYTEEELEELIRD